MNPLTSITAVIARLTVIRIVAHGKRTSFPRINADEHGPEKGSRAPFIPQETEVFAAAEILGDSTVGAEMTEVAGRQATKTGKNTQKELAGCRLLRGSKRFEINMLRNPRSSA